MQFPEDLENTPFKWKIFSNFVAFSKYLNFNRHEQMKIEEENFMIKMQILQLYKVTNPYFEVLKECNPFSINFDSVYVKYYINCLFIMQKVCKNNYVITTYILSTIYGSGQQDLLEGRQWGYYLQEVVFYILRTYVFMGFFVLKLEGFHKTNLSKKFRHRIRRDKPQFTGFSGQRGKMPQVKQAFLRTLKKPEHP